MTEIPSRVRTNPARKGIVLWGQAELNVILALVCLSPYGLFSALSMKVTGTLTRTSLTDCNFQRRLVKSDMALAYIASGFHLEESLPPQAFPDAGLGREPRLRKGSGSDFSSLSVVLHEAIDIVSRSGIMASMLNGVISISGA